MALRPTLSTNMRDQLVKLDRNDMKAISRLPLLDTDDEEFGAIFAENPGAALAAKGIEVTPQEIDRIQEQLGQLSRPGGGGVDKAETEVTVGIKVKF